MYYNNKIISVDNANEFCLHLNFVHSFSPLSYESGVNFGLASLLFVYKRKQFSNMLNCFNLFSYSVDYLFQLFESLINFFLRIAFAEGETNRALGTLFAKAHCGYHVRRRYRPRRTRRAGRYRYARQVE